MTGSHPYVFPAFILTPGSSVTVYSGKGTMNDTALFMGLDEPVWGNTGDTALFMGLDEPVWGNTGDTALLKDGSGNIIDRRS